MKRRRHQGVSLRPATRADIDQMIRIWHAIWDHSHRYYFPERADLRGAADEIRAQVEPVIAEFSVITHDGGIVGFGSHRGELIDDMWICPSFQGRRLGARLLGHLADLIREKGHRRAVLHVIARNHGARRFYEREGWRFVRYEARPLGKDQVPFVVYERDL